MKANRLAGVFLAAATVVTGTGIIMGHEREGAVTGRLASVGCDNYNDPEILAYTSIEIVESGRNRVNLDVSDYFTGQCTDKSHPLLGEQVRVDYKRSLWSDITQSDHRRPKNKVVGLTAL